MASGSGGGGGDDYCWDAQKMLDLYLHDYLVKKKMYKTASIFRKEADVPTNPVVIASPDGFLHEWWTIFSDVYAHGQQKHQEAKEKAFAKMILYAEQLMPSQLQCVHPIVPHESAIGQLRAGQYSIGTNFDKMLGQPAACLLAAKMLGEEQQHLPHPIRDFDANVHLVAANKLNLSRSAATSSSSLQQQLHNQERFTRDIRNGFSTGIGRANPTLYGVQKGISPSTEPQDGGVNPASLEGRLLNSLIQTPNDLQQLPMLAEQFQQNLLAHSMSNLPGNLRSAFPRSSANVPPKTKSNVRGSRMMVNLKKTEELQGQLNQGLQWQWPETGKRRKRSSLSKTGTKTSDCSNALANKAADENVESFLLTDDGNVENKGNPFSSLKRPTASSNSNNTGFTFEEIVCLQSSKNKVLCCDFSSDGKLLASAGHEKKVWIWNMGTFHVNESSEGHSLLVTDIRFRPTSTICATSSFDKTVHIWDATKPCKSLFKLVGHNEQVMSLDFHPRKVDTLCSCDSGDEIRLWNVNKCACLIVTKGATKQVRFQPQCGKLMAAASGNSINLIDAEIGKVQFSLKEHVKDILSISWDVSGNHIASVSEDSARVWSLASGGKCVYELRSNGNRFQSCTFHLGYSELLIIGGYQNLELWNPTEGNTTWPVLAHKGLIAALAVSPENELIASASHDQCVKIWK